MDFVVVSLVFALFFAGVVLAVQGLVGKEINPEGQPFAMPIKFDQPGMEHPPERHRGRLMLGGVGLMVLAVVLGLFVI